MSDNKRQDDINSAAAAYAEFINKGGKVSKIPEGQRTDPADVKSQWGKPRAKAKGPAVKATAKPSKKVTS